MGYFKASDVLVDVPASVPLIGYNNLVTVANLTSSTFLTGFPVSNLANPATHLKWIGAVNTGDELVTVSLPATAVVDYLAVVGHNFGSTAQFVNVEGTDPAHILLLFDGADASTTITDNNSLGGAHVWTAQGNAQIDTADSKFGGASLLLDGTGDFVSTPDHTDFTLGQSDFTIECWFKCNAAGGTERYLAGHVAAAFTAAVTSFYLRRNTSSFIEFGVSDGVNFFQITSTSTFTNAVNTGWHHVAATRNAGVIRLFIDGVLEASGNFGAVIPDSTGTMQVGSAAAVAGTWLGWIDMFRMVVGVAMWTANFTPSTRIYSTWPLVPPAGENTAILLHFDGIDGATSVNDYHTTGISRDWTFAGNAQVDTAIDKFGDGALLLDGTGDWLTTPTQRFFNVDANDFTIDCWFNVAAGAGTFRWLCGMGNGSINRGPMIFLTSANQMRGSVFKLGVEFSCTSTTTFTTAGWHHVAFVRSGNNLKLFIDGVQEGGNTAFTGSADESATVFGIGVEGSAAGNSWNGSIDEFRYIVGRALWSSNFTPPTTASSATSSVIDDSPILFRWVQRPLANVRLRLRPDVAAPQAAVIYVGKLLVLERSITIDQGHVPITYGRRTKVLSGMSETGNFLGRIVLGEYRESKAEFEWFRPDFYRSYIDAFLNSAQEAPFFWVWNPDEYPAEVGYVWLTNNAEPETDPVTRRIALTLEMRGVA